MSFNLTLFLQDNFISRFSIICCFYQNTRKAGSHHQILLLYNDFKSVHDAKKVPSTSGQKGCWYCVTNQQTSDSLGKTRGVAQIREETMLVLLEYDGRHPTVKPDKAK